MPKAPRSRKSAALVVRVELPTYILSPFIQPLGRARNALRNWPGAQAVTAWAWAGAVATTREPAIIPSAPAVQEARLKADLKFISFVVS